MKYALSLIALAAALPALAEDTRHVDAHEHGVGTLDIAVDGTTVAMTFEAPGADIVGFEYAAKSDADLAAVDLAIATLAAPLDLFVMPDAAGCTVVEALAELESEDAHDDHSGEKHDDHAHEEHDDHAHEEHGDDDHADEAGHTEFHAQYTLTCVQPDALTKIEFAYFDAFPGAQEVDVQIITASGAQAFEVARDAPVLELEH
nr:DUF2796 domain-containing protein [uncultured Shimia sp.]